MTNPVPTTHDQRRELRLWASSPLEGWDGYMMLMVRRLLDEYDALAEAQDEQVKWASDYPRTARRLAEAEMARDMTTSELAAVTAERDALQKKLDLAILKLDLATKALEKFANAEGIGYE